VGGNHEEREDKGNTISSKRPRKQPKTRSDGFFVDKCWYQTSTSEPEVVGNRKDLKSRVVSILHQNAQTLNKNLLDYIKS
jgi:hypothetical protein